MNLQVNEWWRQKNQRARCQRRGMREKEIQDTTSTTDDDDDGSENNGSRMFL